MCQPEYLLSVSEVYQRVFPATVSQGIGAASHEAVKSSLKRSDKARARRAHAVMLFMVAMCN